MAIQCNALCAGTSSCQISDILQSQHQSPVAILRIKLQTASGVVSLGKVRRNLSRSKSEARCQSLLVPLSEIRLLTNCFEIKRLLLASISCSVACGLFDFTQCAEGCGATVQDLLEITRSRLLPLAWARMSRQTRQLLLCLTVLVQQQVWQLPTAPANFVWSALEHIADYTVVLQTRICACRWLLHQTPLLLLLQSIIQLIQL